MGRKIRAEPASDAEPRSRPPLKGVAKEGPFWYNRGIHRD